MSDNDEFALHRGRMSGTSEEEAEGDHADDDDIVLDDDDDGDSDDDEEEVSLEEEEEEEDDDGAPPPPPPGEDAAAATAATVAAVVPPPGPDLREIGDLAVWSATSAKSGNGVELLRDGQCDTFWQSDGMQPHLINIQFQRRMEITELRLYLDHRVDESYTPSRVSVRAGTHTHDLKEVCLAEVHEPCGWVVIPLWSPLAPPPPLPSPPLQRRGGGAGGGALAGRRPPRQGQQQQQSPPLGSRRRSSEEDEDGEGRSSEEDEEEEEEEDDDDGGENAAPPPGAAGPGTLGGGPPLRAFLLQVAVLSNHQSGRDTHVRQARVYGPRPARMRAAGLACEFGASMAQFVEVR